MSKSITIRLEEELHREIKVKVAKEGTSITQYLLELIKTDLEKDAK